MDAVAVAEAVAVCLMVVADESMTSNVGGGSGDNDRLRSRGGISRDKRDGRDEDMVAIALNCPWGS